MQTGENDSNDRLDTKCKGLKVNKIDIAFLDSRLHMTLYVLSTVTTLRTRGMQWAERMQNQYKSFSSGMK